MTLLRYRALPFTLFDQLLEQLGEASRLAPAPEASDDGYTISLALPGVPPEAIDLSIEGSNLAVTVRDPEDEGGSAPGATPVRRAFSWVLPQDIDPEGIRADCQYGMLTITVPRAERAKARRIEVTGTTTAKQVGPGMEQAEAGAEPPTDGT